MSTQPRGSAPEPGASPSTRRELRPRQAADARGTPPGATPRAASKPGGRLTRSSAAQTTRANPSGHDSAPPPLPPQISSARTTRRSHKRAASPDSGSQGRRAKRSRPRSGFYEEDDDSEIEGDDLDDGSDSDSPLIPVMETPPPASARRSRPRRAAPGSSKKKSTAATPTRRRAVQATRSTPGKSQPSVAIDTPTDPAVIPDWLSVPYHIWVQIFQYASAPLDDRDQVTWLLSTSRICRAFAEPALTALYQCPPLLTRPMAHNLVSLLSMDPSTTMFNYRAKVEKLRIDVEEIAARSYRGQPLDFRALVANLPRLKVVDFSHPKDLPPFRRLDDNLKWHYPDSLFEALNGAQSSQSPEGGASGSRPTKLNGWRWNRRMMPLDTDLAWIKTLHMTPSFAGLKKLCFVNYQVPSLHAPSRVDDAEAVLRDQEFVRGLADVIAVLPDLEYLSIESSTVVNDEFLSLLPKSLRTLELVNCWEIDGEDFASYLLSHGRMLQHLNLHHNQSLSLAFLTILGTACPNLQTLCMDLKNFNHHEFYHDSDPNYAEVLSVDQVPNWPASLETIELRNMRKWSAEAAEVLFQSLVDSAPKLKRLRHLDLKTMLDIPFRQRSALRDKWEAKLKRVFLRKKEDPKPLFSLRSKPPGAAESVSTPKKGREPKKSPRISAGSESAARRSSRLATQASNPSSRESSVGKDLRRVGHGRPKYAEVDTDEDELDEEKEEDDEEEEENEDSGGEKESDGGAADEEGFRHGMCETVEIQLDNQKPTERTWQMEDFLDEDASDDPSDEDWDGDRDADVEYAW